MLDIIGESAFKMKVGTHSHPVLAGNEALALKKAHKSVNERPVEKSQKSADPESGAEKERGQFDIDEEGLFFAKYDKNGNVILRLPPEQKPIDEHV